MGLFLTQNINAMINIVKAILLPGTMLWHAGGPGEKHSL
jgi:hypothetical protein